MLREDGILSVQLSDNDFSVLCRYSLDSRDEGGMATFIIQLLIGPLNGSLEEEGWPCCSCGKDDHLKAACKENPSINNSKAIML